MSRRTSSPSTEGSSVRISSSTPATSSRSGRSAWRRPKANSCRVSNAARWLAVIDPIEMSGDDLRAVDLGAGQRPGVHDRGEQVIELVCDAAGQPSDRIHLLRVDELFLEALALA